jgi:serine/threonine-protein kinase
MNSPSHPGGAPTLPTEGTVLAQKYRVERVLGAGGMGVVVAAMHLSLDERVALKFLHPTMASPEALARFGREARAAAKIKSEHVARVTDVGTLDTGSPYLVMEYLEGADLGRVLAERGPLPIRDAVEYVLQACDAVAEAHTLGIVHRDLKPSNLFLAKRAGGPGIVKVLDFGISKVMPRGATPPPDGDMGMTRTRAWLGSPLYMSPEQMRSARDVDARGDVWALGVILFELLTGKPPFDAQTFPELCAQIMHAEPTPVQRLRPDVPAALIAAIAKCLAKDPAQRFPTVAHLVLALVDLAPRRTRSVAERTVALTEAAGLMPSSEVARPALDGTLPEPRMSPLRNMPLPRPSTDVGSATHAVGATPAPSAGSGEPTSALAVTRAPAIGSATATWFALAAVVATVFGVGLYLRTRYAADPPAPVSADATQAPAEAEVEHAASALIPSPAPTAAPTETQEVAAPATSASATPATLGSANQNTPAPRSAPGRAGGTPAPRAGAPTAPRAGAAAPTTTAMPQSAPASQHAPGDIGGERCFVTQPDGTRAQVPCPRDH